MVSFTDKIIPNFHYLKQNLINESQNQAINIVFISLFIIFICKLLCLIIYQTVSIIFNLNLSTNNTIDVDDENQNENKNEDEKYANFFKWKYLLYALLYTIYYLGGTILIGIGLILTDTSIIFQIICSIILVLTIIFSFPLLSKKHDSYQVLGYVLAYIGIFIVVIISIWSIFNDFPSKVNDNNSYKYTIVGVLFILIGIILSILEFRVEHNTEKTSLFYLFGCNIIVEFCFLCCFGSIIKSKCHLIENAINSFNLLFQNHFFFNLEIITIFVICFSKWCKYLDSTRIFINCIRRIVGLLLTTLCFYHVNVSHEQSFSALFILQLFGIYLMVLGGTLANNQIKQKNSNELVPTTLITNLRTEVEIQTLPNNESSINNDERAIEHRHLHIEDPIDIRASPIDFIKLEQVIFYGGNKNDSINPDRVYVNENGNIVAYFGNEKCLKLKNYVQKAANTFYDNNRNLLYSRGYSIHTLINCDRLDGPTKAQKRKDGFKNTMKGIWSVFGLYAAVTNMAMAINDRSSNVLSNMMMRAYASNQTNAIAKTKEKRFYCSEKKKYFNGIEVGFGAQGNTVSSRIYYTNNVFDYGYLVSLQSIMNKLEEIENLFRKGNRENDDNIKNTASAALSKVDDIFKSNFEKEAKYDSIGRIFIEDVKEIIKIRKYINYLVLSYRWMDVSINLFHLGEMNCVQIASLPKETRYYLSKIDVEKLTEKLEFKVSYEVQRYLGTFNIAKATKECIEQSLVKKQN